MKPTGVRDAAALFEPQRLRVARQLRKLKRAELADRVGVSAAAISQYEGGAAKPRPGTLAQLALQLEMPVGFFGSKGHALPPLETEQGFFRSLRRSSQVDRDAALAQAAILAELVRVIDQRVELPDLDLPRDLTISPEAPLARVEDIADEVRRQWDLGTEPVPNMVRLLERRGVIVARLSLAEDVDAFSWPAPARPEVILSTEKNTRDRSRFDAAHELGHLVMHFADPEPASQPLERQAHRFAGAFLLPASAFREEFEPGRIDWRRMAELKQRWQVSLAALIYRARDLAILSSTQYESAMKQMSRRGWRRREPADLGPPERPALLRKSMELLTQTGFDLDQLAAEADVPRPLVDELVSADEIDRPLVAV